MFPIFYIPPPSRVPQYATADGTAFKHARCEECDFEYVYLLWRRAQAPAWGFLVPDHEGARNKARENLRRLLLRACEPVPCPVCGRYQRNMVRRARQLKYRSLLTASLVSFLAACILVVPLMICGFVLENAAKAQGGPAPTAWWVYVVCSLAFVAWGAAAAAAPLLLILRLVLPWFYDPNAAAVESRIALGRSLAVSWEAFDAGLAYPPPRDLIVDRLEFQSYRDGLLPAWHIRRGT
jgi:hypothetical protein